MSDVTNLIHWSWKPLHRIRLHRLRDGAPLRLCCHLQIAGERSEWVDQVSLVALH